VRNMPVCIRHDKPRDCNRARAPATDRRGRVDREDPPRFRQAGALLEVQTRHNPGTEWTEARRVQ
jgi:hypothetical protein